MRLAVAIVAFLTLPLLLPATNAATADPPAVAMAGSLSPLVPLAVDLGPAPADQRVRVAVGLDLHDKAGLDAFLAAVSDPASPSFQHFLTQDEFNARYGPTEAQETRVIRWLEGAGFRVSERFPNRLLVVAEGDNAAVQSAFGVTEHRVLYQGFPRTAVVDAPRFPADIAKFTTGVVGLDDLTQMHPMHTTPMPVSATPKAAVGASCCAFSPGDLATFYDNAKTYTGSGQTVVIAGAYTWQDSDVTAYDNQWGLPALPTGSAQVCAGSGTACAFDASNSIEVTLDVQMIHAVAPAAVVKNYMSQTTALTDFQTMYNKVVTDNPGHSVSTSWGSCETNSASSYQTQNDNIFANGNAVGQSWFAASGDNGAKDCGGVSTALVVDHPANAPHMMGVGGTHATCSSGMTSGSPNCGGYGSESSWTSGGGGVSNVFAKPSYQTGCSVPADGKRDVPDLAMEADTAPGNYVYYNGAWNTVGGTSDAAPQWGGYFALLNQKLGGSGMGLPGTRVYQMCGTNSYHDVTSGSNGGYSAGVGYDMNTGVGTIDANNFLANYQQVSCTGTAPAAPTALSATAGSGQVSLSWTDGSNGGCAITGHKVYRATSSGAETLLASSGSGTTYTDTAVTGGTTYFYKVTAVNSIGESGLSNEASATPTVSCGSGPANNAFACATSIGTVSSYSTTESTSGATTETGEPAPCGSIGATVWFTWTAPSSGTATVSAVNGSTTYDTVLAAYTGSTLSGLTNVACNDDFSGLQSQISFACTAGTTYRIQLGGYNGATGTAGFWLSGCGAVATTVPGAPTGLAASPGNAQVALSWSAPASNGGSAITGYKVYRGTTSGGETLLATLGNVLSYTDTGLTNGQAYFYKVSAVNAAGEGALSSEASATPQATVSGLSQNFDAGTGTPSGWTFTGLWHVASNCQGAHSAPNSLQYNRNSVCDYNTGAQTTGDATSPAFDISASASPTLTFWTKYQVESYTAGSYDQMQVQVKTATGAWTTIWTKDSTTAAQTTWAQVSLSLASYKSTGTQVRFHFDSVDGLNNAFPGWAVDDVAAS